MGKTAVMRSLRSAVGERDLTFLSAHPTEPERRLAFSGLTDLLSDLPVEEYDALPAPQRAALRSALLLEESAEEVSPLAVAAGIRTLLRARAASRPVLLVVDDAQWLDDATTTVLAAALRRLQDVPVSVVAAARPAGRRPMDWIADPPDQVALTPLSAPALFQVIRSHLDISPGRGELLEIERASGGNPLYALEFARHKRTQDGFDELVGDRLRSLPRATRLALLATALAPDARVQLIADARERTCDQLLEDLDPAARAGLLTVTEQIEFAHPLFAHAVTETAAAVDVRETHRRLAALEATGEARARHLAQASTGPDAALADQLAEAAEEARRRGGWDSSIDLLKLALERTLDADQQAQRATRLAEWLSMASRFDEAEQLLLRARTCGHGETYWSATLELCDLRLSQGHLRELTPLIDELGGADLPPLLRGRFLLDYAVNWPPESPASSILERVRAASRELAGLPEGIESRRLQAQALIGEGYLTEYLARGPGDELFDRAWTMLDGPHDRWRQVMESQRGFRLFQESRYDEARTFFAETLRAADERGDEAGRAMCLLQLATIDMVAGRWAEAEEHSRSAWEASLGQGELVQEFHEVYGAWLQGLRGDAEGAERRLQALVDMDEREGMLHALALHRGMLASVLLAHGQTERAYELLVAARASADAIECLDPTHLPVDDGLIIAMIQTGRVEEAREHIQVVRERCLRIGRGDELLPVLELLVKAAAGDVEDAAAALPAALARFEDECKVPTNVAEAHLMAGRVFRRARQKRLAAESLTKAIEIYESLPCPPYAEQARAELARVGLRPRAPDTLTETERQVAELATQGLRNKEIAEQAFISAKTVEAVLGRVYRKLGIRSRAGLGRALRALDPHA